MAALFILPFALSRDPEICVLNAIGLAYVLFQLRRFVICTLGNRTGNGRGKPATEAIAGTSTQKQGEGRSKK